MSFFESVVLIVCRTFQKEIEKCLEDFEASGRAFTKYERRLSNIYGEKERAVKLLRYYFRGSIHKVLIVIENFRGKAIVEKVKA